MKNKKVLSFITLISVLIISFLLTGYHAYSKFQNREIIKLLDHNTEAFNELEIVEIEKGTVSSKIVENGDELTVVHTDRYSNGRPFNGTSLDGLLIDESTPFKFIYGNESEQQTIIDAWVEGLKGRREGDILRLYIPSELAYGEVGSDRVPPNQDVITDIKILSITKKSELEELEKQKIEEEKKQEKSLDEPSQSETQEENVSE